MLTLTSVDTTNEFISTSLDQTVSVWTHPDGKFKCSLPGSQEPVQFVATNCREIITGSTANRITVRTGTSLDSVYLTSKLRSEILKSSMSAMKFLPMNRLLLVGQENGLIRLIC